MKRAICILLALSFAIAAAADGNRVKTVVIDAGHGGKDPGAVSADKKTYEKTLVLDICQRLAARIQEGCPDVKVILTRTSDRFVELADRSSIANKANADLFISVHINAAANKSANGFSVHLLGQSSQKNRDLFSANMDIVKRENSVILLEDDFSERYQGFDPDDPASYIFMTLSQNANLEQSFRFAQTVEKNLKGGPITGDRGVEQNPFMVLWQTSMPAVLVELGFISNANDLAKLRSQDSRSDLAGRLFNAFCEYKSLVETGTAVTAPAAAAAAPSEAASVETSPAEAAPAETAPAEMTPAAPAEDAVQYGIQILAGSKKLPAGSKEFLGYSPKIIKAGNIYRYIISVSDSADTVKKNLPAIRKKYPDAFAVIIRGDSTERLK